MESIQNSRKGYRILVTGGSGFVGRFLIDQLLDASSPVIPDLVTIYDIQPPQERSDQRVTYIRGDIRDPELLADSCKGMDLVIHTAAIIDWGTRSKQKVTEVNYGGTVNVLQACLKNRVQAMIYTSSLDVMYDGRPKVHVDEKTPYPVTHSNAYCRSKYLAEKRVLDANGNRLKTCSLRPADIYGEGDPYHIGSLINMARAGFYIRLGNGRSQCQHVYVGNAAHAHLLAADALLNGNSRVPGQAYFITDGPGSNFFRFFDHIVERAGYRIRPRNLWLPRGFAYGLGVLSEGIALLVRPVKKYAPKLSRFAVVYTCTDYTFTSRKASEEFGFAPKYTVEEAIGRTARYYQS